MFRRFDLTTEVALVVMRAVTIIAVLLLSEAFSNLQFPDGVT